MHIQEAVPRRRQHVRREDPPVGNDEAEIEVLSLEPPIEFLRRLGLEHGEPAVVGSHLDGTCLAHSAPTSPAIRLRDHEIDVGDVRKGVQARDCWRWRAEEDRSHGYTSRCPRDSSLSSARAARRTRCGRRVRRSRPFRWSISCWRTRPRSSSPSYEMGVPSRSTPSAQA